VSPNKNELSVLLKVIKIVKSIMKKISIQKLTVENFKIYGSFSNLINPKSPRLGPEPIEFYRDIEQLNIGQSNVASFSVCRVSKRPLIIQKLEFHNYTSEGLLPLDGDVLIHVALASRNGEVPVDKIEVFLIPKGTFVTIRPGVWHHAPFAYGCDYVNAMVVLPERTYAKDCFVSIIPEADQLEIEI
jgi:ureidoglycolate lyase